MFGKYFNLNFQIAQFKYVRFQFEFFYLNFQGFCRKWQYFHSFRKDFATLHRSYNVHIMLPTTLIVFQFLLFFCYVASFINFRQTVDLAEQEEIHLHGLFKDCSILTSKAGRTQQPKCTYKFNQQLIHAGHNDGHKHVGHGKTLHVHLRQSTFLYP